MVAQEEFKQWGILELMGHRRLAGLISEIQIAGTAFIRIDIPGSGGPLFGDDGFTQIYNPQAVYCFTPTSEEDARKAAKCIDPTPVKRWELPHLEEKEEY